MLLYLWIALGGGIGTILRYVVGGMVARQFGESFPFGTLAVNVTGSFIIGFFAALTAPDGRWMVSPMFRSFFMLGVCGGYTTFSSFSLQTLDLANDGQWLHAGLNALFSFTLCLVAVWLGHVIGLSLKSTKGL